MIKGFTKLLCLAAMATASLSSVAHAADKLRVGLLPIVDVSPIHVGIKKGFFAAEGLELELVPSSSGAVGIPAIVGGALDITYGNTVSTILAANQNLDVKIIAVTLEGAPELTSLIARKEDNIKSGKDLNGKTIAVNARNNIIWLYAREWIVETGGDASKVNFREVGFPQMPDALTQKQVDIVMTPEPFRTKLLESSAMVEVEKPYKFVSPGVQVGNYVASGALVKDKKPVVDRFLKALATTNKWFDQNLNNDEVISIIADYTKAPKEVILISPPRKTLPGISVEEMTKTMKLMRKHGILNNDVDVSQIVYKP